MSKMGGEEEWAVESGKCRGGRRKQLMECRMDVQIHDVLDVSRSRSGSSDAGGGSSDAGGGDSTSEEEDSLNPLIEGELKRKRTSGAEKAREYRAKLSKERHEQIKENNKLRSREKRANMTPAEKEMAREKQKIRSRQTRAKLEGKLWLDVLKKRTADATRMRRKEIENVALPAEKATIPGETYGDRMRRLGRIRIAKRRREIGPQPLEVRVKEVGHTKIVQWVDRLLLTVDEKHLKNIQARQNREKRRVQGIEPEVEDDIAWRNFFLFQMKLEFLVKRKKLVEEALEIELGPHVPIQESPLLDPNWSAGTQHCSSVNKDRISSTDATSNQSDTVHNRWKGVVDNDSDDGESNAILQTFNQVQIKIEADELVEQWNCDDDVADWIARVITNEEGNDEQVGTSNASGQDISTVERRASRSQFAKTKATEQLHDIFSAPTMQEKGRILGHWRWLAIKTAQEERLDKLQRIFLTTRQSWIDKNPEDTEKRVKVDEERIAVKERVRSQKTEAVDLIILQLIQKRNDFSQETQAVREARIVKYHGSVITNLLEEKEMHEKRKSMTEAEKEEKRQQKIRLSLNLTKEEMRAYNAANSRLRTKMEKAEYDLHLALLAATGFKIPPPKFETRSRKDKAANKFRTGATGSGTISVEDFENAFRVDIYAQCIQFWDKTVLRTRTEVISYRNLMLEYLSKRRKRIDELANSLTSELVQSEGVVTDNLFHRVEGHSECRFEWISLPEAKSLEDIARFQSFIKKYGEPVINHLTFKRFYMHERQMLAKLRNTNDEKGKEEHRIKSNVKLRKRYIRNKYGIILGEGEYFDKRTMSAVKKPPKVYLAWKKKKEGTGQAVVSEQNHMLPNKAKATTTRPKSTRVRKNGKPTSTPITSPTRAARDARASEPQSQPTAAVPTCNSNDDLDYSNSSGGFADSCPVQEGEDSSDGWVPLGSFEMDSVIRNDILNLPPPRADGNQQQNFHIPQSQHTSTASGMQLRSRDLHIQQLQQPYQHFVQSHHHQNPQMPRLQLVDQFTNTNQMDANYNSQMQWNPNAPGVISEPLNYAHQFLPNSQISLLQSQQYSSPQFALNPQSCPWNSASSSSMSNPVTSYLRNQMPHLEPQPPLLQFQHDNPTPKSSAAADTLSISSEVELSSPPDLCSPKQKKPRGRPKGWKMTLSAKISQQAKRKRTFNPGQKRDIWNNRKRRKYYINSTSVPQAQSGVTTTKFESPFERNPEQMRASAMMENISNLLPKCPQCDKIVDHDTALEAHIALQHPDPKIAKAKIALQHPDPKIAKAKIACEVCSEQFEKPTNLVQHMFTVHFEVKQYKCPFGCIRSLYNRKRLRHHILDMHANEAKVSWIMGIKDLKTLPGKIKFWCLNCQKCYSTYSELKTHCKETHEKFRYCCVHCGIYLRMENHWTDHVKLFHPEKPLRVCPLPVEVDQKDLFRCIKCHSEFSAQSFLDEHAAKGHSFIEDCNDNSKNRKPFFCRVCDKRYHTEQLRDNHFKTCKDRNHECYWCKQKAESASLVQCHIKELHPQEPPVPENREDYSYSHAPYKCEICKKSYMSLHSLRLHCIYDHQLYKYYQTVKEKNLMNPPEELTNGNSVVAEDIKAVPKEAITKSQSVDEPDPIIISCPVCETTDHNLHQTHKAFDKLMRRYCAQCDRLFSRTTMLRSHNEAAHSILPEQPPSGRTSKLLPTEDPCGWVKCNCGRSFTNQEFHQHHLFFEKDTDVRTCVHCNKKFFNTGSYLKHIHNDHGVPINEKMVVRRVSEKNRKRELVQEDYDKLSSTTTVKTAAGEMTIFTCKVCLKNFKTLQFLYAHISEAHKEDAFTRVVCNTCNCTFASRNNLKRHEKHHQQLYRVLCPICDLSMSQMKALREHVRKYHRNQPFNVTDVKKVPLEEALQVANSFFCKICFRMFQSDAGLKSHMTTKHFPTHWSTFCEFCGLQMNPKTIKQHVATYHQLKNDDVVVRPGTRNKKRLSLPELVELVQAVYDKIGYRSSKLKQPKKKTNTKRRSSKTPSKRRKKQKDSDSEDVEEISLDESDTEESDASIFSSDDEDDEGDYVGYGRDESETEESDSNKTLCQDDEGPKRIIKSKASKRTREEDSDSEGDSAYIKYSTGTRSRPARKMLDVSNSGSNFEHDPAKLGIHRTKKKMQGLPDSDHEGDDTNYKEDDGSDIDLTPVEAMHKPVTRQKPASTIKAISRNLKSTRVLNRVANPSSNPPPPTVNLDQYKRLVICLERCDKDTKLVATSSRQSACYKPSPKSLQPIAQSSPSKMVSDIVIMVKDEIDDIGPDQDRDDANSLNLLGLLEPKSPLTSASQWQYVDIETAEDDDQDELNTSNSDPLSGIHPGCL